MNTRRLFFLLAFAVIALSIAMALRTTQQPRTESESEAKPLLPALRDHLNDVSAITFTGAGGKVIATLQRDKDGWHIAERSGYPADLNKIRDLLIKLDRSMLIEQKTSSPQHYAELGVEDVKNADAKGVQIALAGLATPTDLIIGTFSAPSRGTFVRHGNEPQSWLTSGDLTVSKATAEWEKRDVVDVGVPRLATITLTSPEGHVLKVSKDEAHANAFTVAQMPAGRAIDQGAVSSLASTLTGLRFEDVVPAKDEPPPEQAHKARYVTFDGVTIDATAWTKDGKSYAQFAATLDRAAAEKRIAGDQAKTKVGYEAAVRAAGSKSSASESKSSGAESDKAQEPRMPEIAKPRAVSDPAADSKTKLDALTAEVDALNNACGGWTFVLASYTYANMTKAITDVLLPVETKKPEASIAPGMTPPTRNTLPAGKITLSPGTPPKALSK
jgi:hypothetical protein